jgi:hypothetical protein
MYLHVIWEEAVRIKLRCTWGISFFSLESEGDTVVRIEENNLFIPTQVQEHLSCSSVHWVEGSVSETNRYSGFRTAYHCEVARFRPRCGWARCKPMLCMRDFGSASAVDICYVICSHSWPTTRIGLDTQVLPVFLPLGYWCFAFYFGFNIAPGNLLPSMVHECV